MARLDSKASRHRTKPWKAEIKIRYVAHYIGHYSTREEADLAERQYRFEHRGDPEPRRYHERLVW